MGVELPELSQQKASLTSIESKELEFYLQEYNQDLIADSLIKNEIATKNDIKVEYEEVLAKTKEMIRGQFGMMGGGAAGNEMDEMIDRIATGYLTDKNKQDNFRKMFDENV